MGTAKKPPIGVIPKYVWDSKRLNELNRAINAYNKEFLQIPPEWIEEYNELLIRNNVNIILTT